MAKQKFLWTADRARQVQATRYRTLITRMESGVEQRRSKGKRPRRWQLSFQKQNIWGPRKNHAEEIRKFFEAKQGQYESFLWDYVHDDGEVEEVEVRFGSDILERQEDNHTQYDFQLELVEVLS